MAMGQAAGIAASLSIEDGVPLRNIDILKLQRRLLERGAVLVYFKDAKPGDRYHEALQFFAVRGFYPIGDWEAKLAETAPADVASKWIKWSGVARTPAGLGEQPTRGELLGALYEELRKRPAEEISGVRGRW